MQFKDKRFKKKSPSLVGTKFFEFSMIKIKKQLG